MNVAIAIIKENQKVLITKRGRDVHLPSLWEFPGGKQLPHETLEECLKREILEELKVDIKIERSYGKIEHIYPDRTVTLYPYICHLLNKTLSSTPEMQWVLPQALFSYPFPEANLPLLSALAEEKPTL